MPGWLEQVRRFDDATWAALASVGLLRRARKDLARGGAPVVIDEADTDVSVEIGGRRVVFDAGGPAHAECSCPSHTVCRHIIAAGLWLAESRGAGDSVTDLHDELMALQAADFTAHAGRPGHRWAWSFVDELDEADVVITGGGTVRIAFPRLQVTLRYAGGGLAGLIADQKLAPLPRYQVAAVIAYQRANGTAMDFLAAAKTVTKQQESHAANRERFRRSTRQLLVDTVALGVAHPSVALHERYETTAVWAQGAEYHRISLLLNRIADHVAQMLARSATTGTAQLVAEIALAYALVEALDFAATTGHEPIRLVGQARNTYTPVRAMTVIGMGSVPWHASSGYHGLTTLFWWPDRQRFLSLTDARPSDLWGFDPVDRFAEPGPWTGLASPGAAAGRRLELSNARLNPAGRLSAVDSTHASVEFLTGTEVTETLNVVDRWSELRSGLLEADALLDPPDPLADWVVLRPSAFDDAQFDQTTQTLRWPIADALGDEIMVTVGYGDLTVAAIERIEALGRRVPAGTLLVARLHGSGLHLTAEPLSLINPDAELDAVDSLHFGEASDAGTPPAQPVRAPFVPERIPLTMTAVRAMRAWLVRVAERGISGGRDEPLVGELSERHRRLRDQGFVVYPSESSASPAEQLLRSYCITEQVDRVLSRRT